MAHEHMTAEQVQRALMAMVGETDSAELRQDIHCYGLYIHKEENGQWLFVGTVDDADAAQDVITQFFDHYCD